MDLLIKYIKRGTLTLFCLGLILLSQTANAQFKHRWQTEITAGMAVPYQDKYYISQGYPNISLVGNLAPGIKVQGQLLRNLNSWSSAGAGVEQARFSSLKVPDGRQQIDLNLNSTTVNLSGRIYFIGKNHRLTPFLQAGLAYSQVKVIHGNYAFSVDSLSQQPRDSDFPVFLRIDYTKPASNQESSVIGASATAGAELLLNDVVGLTWQISYKLHKTKQMELLQEDLAYWDYSFGMFFRMFKTKRAY